MKNTEKHDATFKRKVIISTVLSVIAVVYIIYHIVMAFAPETQLYVVTYADYDDTEIFSGYIFHWLILYESAERIMLKSSLLLSILFDLGFSYFC